MKVARLVKIISVTFSLLLLLIVGLAVYVLTLDPNDYKPQIENLAREQGVDLQIRGELGWQIYPVIALELDDIALSMEQPGMSVMANLDLAELDINLWPLFSGELSVRGIRVDGVELSLNETLVEQPPASESAETGAQINLPQIGAEEISLQNLHIYYQPLMEDMVSLSIAELTAEQFNLAGEAFPVSLALELDYSGQHLNLRMDSELTLDQQGQRYRLASSDLEAGMLGERSFSSQISLLADLDMGSGNWQLGLENIQIDDLAARLDVTGSLEPMTAAGELSLEGGAGLISRLTDTDLVQALSVNTGFDYRSNTLVLDSFNATINRSQIAAQLQYFLDGAQASQLEVEIDQINVDDYLPADPQQAGASANEQNPLAFLESVPPFHIQLNISDLTASGYQVSDLDLLADIADARATIALQHAGLAEGDIAANLVLQANTEPQVRINSLNASDLQLGQLVVAENGEPVVEGQATFRFGGVLRSLTGEDFLAGLSGDGLLSVDGLYTPNWNIEQNICVSAERLGATPALQSNWAAGTSFTSFSSPVLIRNGVATLEEITSGFGNISFTGGGALNLVSMDLSAQLALLVQGDRTSEQGCSINSYVRNTELPLSCEGNIAEGGEMSCGLDNAVIQALLTGRVQNEIQNRLQRLIAPSAETEEGSEEEVVDPTQQLFQDALRGILRPGSRQEN